MVTYRHTANSLDSRVMSIFGHPFIDNDVSKLTTQLKVERLQMSTIRLNSKVTKEFIAGMNSKQNDGFTPQGKSHLLFMLEKNGYNWFDKDQYVKQLGYEGMDVKIFGKETKGNIISNFRWYFTRWNEAGLFETGMSINQSSEIEELKKIIEEQQAEIELLKEQLESK